MEERESEYRMHDCELSNMPNCHHDGNIVNVLSAKESRYCNNAERCVTRCT